jgi:hypothetical protein
MRQGESKMAFFEHRSGAYMTYVSIGAQKKAICRPHSRGFKTASDIDTAGLGRAGCFSSYCF